MTFSLHGFPAGAAVSDAGSVCLLSVFYCSTPAAQVWPRDRQGDRKSSAARLLPGVTLTNLQGAGLGSPMPHWVQIGEPSTGTELAACGWGIIMIDIHP